MKAEGLDTQKDLSILVVDDESTLRRSIELNLQQHGYFCRGASDAQQALALLDQGNFDIVVCDQRLPGSDGISFIKLCRERDSDLAVILMTGFGYDPGHSIVKARQAGLQAVLYKPFRLDQLLNTIEQVVNVPDSVR